LVSSKTKDKFFSDGAITYIKEKVAELHTGEVEPQPYSRSIEWGNDHEAEAMGAYIEQTGHDVIYYGGESPKFFRFPDNGVYAGGSPDGIVPNNRIVEIKCPYNTVNHIENCIMTLDEFKSKRKEYYSQCQLLMLITSTLFADFCSYDPRMNDDNNKLSILEVPYDAAFCANMVERIRIAGRLRDEIYNKVKHIGGLSKAS
jgi:hypothetical protein